MEFTIFIALCITVIKMYTNHVYIATSFISLRPGEASMSHDTGPLLVQLMACHSFDDKQ